MLWEIDIGLLRVDYSLSALAQRSFEQRDGAGGISGQLVGQLFAVRYDVGNINVAVVPSHKDIVSDLVSVNVHSVDLEGQDKLFEFGNDFRSRLAEAIVERRKHTERVSRPRIHLVLL